MSLPMIMHSFSFLPSIGKVKERNLWELGVLSWRDFLSRNHIKGISPYKKALLNKILGEALNALYDGRAEFFKGFKDSWRLFDYFREEALYVDVEVDGLRNPTVVSFSDGEFVKSFVKGLNLDAYLLQEVVDHYKLLVTFNGSGFDIPLLSSLGLNLSRIVHIDLRAVAMSLGFSEGLKSLESFIGVTRDYGFDGKIKHGDPSLLWRTWLVTRDYYYLDILIKYNQDDTIILSTLANKMIKELWSRTFSSQFLLSPQSLS